LRQRVRTAKAAREHLRLSARCRQTTWALTCSEMGRPGQSETRTGYVGNDDQVYHNYASKTMSRAMVSALVQRRSDFTSLPCCLQGHPNAEHQEVTPRRSPRKSARLCFLTGPSPNLLLLSRRRWYNPPPGPQSRPPLPTLAIAKPRPRPA
jgi:hypothetical protein